MKSSRANSHDVLLRRVNISGSVSPSSGSDTTLYLNCSIYMLTCSPWLKLRASEGLVGVVRKCACWMFSPDCHISVLLDHITHQVPGLTGIETPVPVKVSGVSPDLDSLLYLAVYLKISMRIGNECYVHRNNPVPSGIWANTLPQMGVEWNVLHLQIYDGDNVYKLHC